MVPPAYSSSSWSELSPAGLPGVSVIIDLRAIEPESCLVGTVEGAREHCPYEDTHRTDAHQQSDRVGANDFKVEHGLLSFLCGVSLGAGIGATRQCGTGFRSLPSCIRARHIGLVGGTRIQ